MFACGSKEITKGSLVLAMVAFLTSMISIPYGSNVCIRI